MRYPLSTEERLQMRFQLGTGKVEFTHDKTYYNVCSHCRLLFRELTTEAQKELLDEIMFLARKMNDKLQDRKWVLMDYK